MAEKFFLKPFKNIRKTTKTDFIDILLYLKRERKIIRKIILLTGKNYRKFFNTFLKLKIFIMWNSIIEERKNLHQVIGSKLADPRKEIILKLSAHETKQKSNIETP